MASDACLVAPPPGDDHQRAHDDKKNGREISMRDLDNEIGTTHRRHPGAVAFRPMVTATHSRAGNTNDGAEDKMEAGHREGGERDTTNRFHGATLATWWEPSP